MTLVEVMLAVAVIIIAALGTLNYEYLCVDHVRFARAQLTAARVAQLLVEDWKSTGGAADYDPQDLNMGFSLPPNINQGNFMTTIDGLPLYITMAQNDVFPKDPSGALLLHLNVKVRWKRDLSAGTVDNDDPGITFDTYVRRDQ